MGRYTVCIVTGTRAEYGLLRPVIKQFLKNDKFIVKLIVTGAHLSEKFGNTVCEIEKDGIEIYKKIDILKFGTSTDYEISKTMAHTLNEFTEFFHNEKTLPDILLVLGDRYEIFSVCLAAAAFKIPVAHISGGDVTYGAADDYYRHCITKISSLHFPSCEEYAKRVIQLGENPKFVHNVGGLGDENLRKLKLLSKDELEASINFDLNRKYALVTYHPETAGNTDSEKQFNELLNAIKNFDIACIFTKANADAGGARINELIDEFCKQNKQHIAFTSMGVLRYLSAMKYCDIVIGNSSSGVVETPSLKVPTVNIGERQKGRINSLNIINCKTDEKSIETAIEKALSDEFIKEAKQAKSPYNGGDTSKKIVDFTLEYINSENYAKAKIFYDI